MRPIESRDYIVETNPAGVYVGKQVVTGYEYKNFDEAQSDASRSSKIESAEAAGFIAAGLTLSALGIYMLMPDGREGIQHYLTEPVHYLGAAVAFIGGYAYAHGLDLYERASELRDIAVRARKELVRRIERKPREVVDENVVPPVEVVEEKPTVELPVSEEEANKPIEPPSENEVVEVEPGQEAVVDEVEIPETPPPPEEAATSGDASEKIPQAPLEGVLAGAGADIDASGPQEDLNEDTSSEPETESEEEIRDETPDEREQRLTRWEESLLEKQEKLEQKSAELEVWEVKLKDWEEKLKSWEERLQNHEERLKEIEKRMGLGQEDAVPQGSNQEASQVQSEDPKGNGKEKVRRAGRRTKKAIQDLAEKIQSTTPSKGGTQEDTQQSPRLVKRTPVDWIEFREILEKPQGELFPDLPQELGHNCQGSECEECKKRRIIAA